MKLCALCDNTDAETGFRLAGIESATVLTPADFAEAFDRALADTTVGVLVLTEKALAYDPERVFEARRTHRMPLVVTLPGGVGGGPAGGDLLRFVSEAVGVSLS